MVEYEGIHEIINQAPVQSVTGVMMVLWNADVGPNLALTASLREPQRQRHGRLTTEKPSFNWNAQDMYVELLNFEMEVLNILGREAYVLTVDKKIPVARSQRLAFYKGIHEWRERKVQNSKRTLFNTKWQIQNTPQQNSAVMGIPKTERKMPWIHPGRDGQLVDKGSRMWL